MQRLCGLASKKSVYVSCRFTLRGALYRSLFFHVQYSPGPGDAVHTLASPNYVFAGSYADLRHVIEAALRAISFYLLAHPIERRVADVPPVHLGGFFGIRCTRLYQRVFRGPFCGITAVTSEYQHSRRGFPAHRAPAIWTRFHIGIRDAFADPLLRQSSGWR